jgi:hypothetical protein
MMKRLIFVSVLLLVASFAQATTVFSENFESGWANGSSGTDLSGGQKNGWTFYYDGVGETWKNNSVEGNGCLGFALANISLEWVAGAKAHGLNIPDTDIKIDVSFRTRALWNSFSWPIVWLANVNQNGYGVGVYNTGNATIVKQSACPNPVAGSQTMPGFGSWQNYLVQTNYSSSDWVTYNFRLEQASSGSPVTITMWHTGGNAVADTSYSNPDYTVIDDGSSPGSFTGGIINLTELSYIELTGYENSLANELSIDDITVRIVPEPATVTMLCLGLVGILSRKKRQ